MTRFYLLLRKSFPIPGISASMRKSLFPSLSPPLYIKLMKREAAFSKSADHRDAIQCDELYNKHNKYANNDNGEVFDASDFFLFSEKISIENVPVASAICTAV